MITRTYLREDGLQVNAISACPDAYVQRFAQEGFVPQLVTGFSIAQLDAVYALGKAQSALYARQGTCIYVIEAQTDEQTLYELGAQARIGL